MNKKIINICISIVILVIIFSVIAYFLNLRVIDPLLSQRSREERELQRASQNFPEKIGEYSIVKELENKVNISSTCKNADDNPTLKSQNKTGQICIETYTATYSKFVSTTTATTTNEIVKINLSKFTKSGDLMKILIEGETKPETLNDYKIFRTAPFRLGWMPISDFDLILSDEGKHLVSSTTQTVVYEGNAEGDNEITQYYLSKYPPKK